MKDPWSRGRTSRSQDSRNAGSFGGFPPIRGSLSASAAAGNSGRPGLRICWLRPAARQIELQARRPAAGTGGAACTRSPSSSAASGKNSINKKLARALGEARRGEARLRYGADRRPAALQPGQRGRPPPAVTRVKAADRGADGVLFVTPEHNRSIPAALKNAIDWASRPSKDSAFKGKVGAIIGTSRGTHLRRRSRRATCRRSSPGCQLDACSTVPEVYINFTDTLIDVDANVTDEAARKILVRFIDGLSGSSTDRESLRAWRRRRLHGPMRGRIAAHVTAELWTQRCVTGREWMTKSRSRSR